MNDDLDQRLRALLKKTTGVEEADDRPFTELPGWDSLRLAEFIVALQKEFKIRFTPSEIAALFDKSAALRVIREKIGS